MEKKDNKATERLLTDMGSLCLTRINHMKSTVNHSVYRYLICSNIKYRRTIWNIYYTVLLLTLFIYPCTANTWQSPGCHRVGHTRPVQIPDCVVFNITLNACRGFCKSFAIPSPSQTLRVNSKHQITSRAECCSIKETHDVKVLVQCIDGLREVIFKSAKSCSCSICRK